MKKIYWQKETDKALKNFRISSQPFPFELIKNIALIKKVTAEVNYELGLIPEIKKQAMVSAAEEIINGKLSDQFPVDIFQAGSATSINMNVNEVIASRANELIIGEIDPESPISPYDDVNRCQSSNDVIPAAINVTLYLDCNDNLVPAIQRVLKTIQKKQDEFTEIIKIGRTHLRGTVPLTFAEEFSGYRHLIEVNLKNLLINLNDLLELPLGGAAVGTGVNAHPDFALRIIEKIAGYYGFPFKNAENHYSAQKVLSGVQNMNNALRNLAVVFFKIGSDLRLTASGSVMEEIFFPEVQAGLSIMPGKVNPVVVEILLQAALTVISGDMATTLSRLSSNFELNTFLPLIFYQTFFNQRIFSRAISTFDDKCLSGIKVNPDKVRLSREMNPALANLFTPYIGYQSAAELAKKAQTFGKSIRQMAKELHVLPDEDIDRIIDDYFIGSLNLDSSNTLS